MVTTERRELNIQYNKIPHPHHFAARMFCKTYENGYGPPHDTERVQRECKERLALCGQLQEIDPDNPTWKYAAQFFDKFQNGPKAILELFGNWGVFEPDKEEKRVGKELHAPEDLRGVRLREFMDLDPAAIRQLAIKHERLSDNNLIPDKFAGKYADFFELTKRAREASWDEYDELKNKLLVLGGVPLLSRDYINTVIRTGPSPKCLIGMSYDELTTYQILYGKRGKDSAPLILGVSRGFSAQMAEAIKRDEITKLSQPEKLITPEDLNSGEAYILEGDIGNSIPIADQKFLIAMLYVLHHNEPRDNQVKLLKMLVEKAVPMGKDGKGVGLLVFEPLSSRALLEMVVETNYWMGHPTALFDAAVGTTICGGQTPESLSEIAKSVNEETGQKTKWRTQTFPNLPPIPLFQKNVLPTQQVALICY